MAKSIALEEWTERLNKLLPEVDGCKNIKEVYNKTKTFVPKGSIIRWVAMLSKLGRISKSKNEPWKVINSNFIQASEILSLMKKSPGTFGRRIEQKRLQPEDLPISSHQIFFPKQFPYISEVNKLLLEYKELQQNFEKAKTELTQQEQRIEELKIRIEEKTVPRTQNALIEHSD